MTECSAPIEYQLSRNTEMLIFMIEIFSDEPRSLGTVSSMCR